VGLLSQRLVEPLSLRFVGSLSLLRVELGSQATHFVIFEELLEPCGLLGLDHLCNNLFNDLLLDLDLLLGWFDLLCLASINLDTSQERQETILVQLQQALQICRLCICLMAHLCENMRLVLDLSHSNIKAGKTAKLEISFAREDLLGENLPLLLSFWISTRLHIGKYNSFILWLLRCFELSFNEFYNLFLMLLHI